MKRKACITAICVFTIVLAISVCAISEAMPSTTITSGNINDLYYEVSLDSGIEIWTENDYLSFEAAINYNKWYAKNTLIFQTLFGDCRAVAEVGNDDGNNYWYVSANWHYQRRIGLTNVYLTCGDNGYNRYWLASVDWNLRRDISVAVTMGKNGDDDYLRLSITKELSSKVSIGAEIGNNDHLRISIYNQIFNKNVEIYWEDGKVGVSFKF